jgi:hypothetical protein
MKKHRIMVLDPGHFHAALPFMHSSHRIDDDIHVYAPQGQGVDSFVGMIETFNQRQEAPTSWRLQIHHSCDPLGDMLKERPGDIAVLAGKNRLKVANTAALAQAGIHVLADKPLVIEPQGLRFLHEALESNAVVLDMMTAREESLPRIQRELIADNELFGGFDTSAGDAIYIESTHCLSKSVNGRQLIRPEWYFDVTEQGEGIVDVATHYADLVLLMLGTGKSLPEFKLLAATHWPTLVSHGEFSAICGAEDWTESIRGAVRNNMLELMANGEIVAECAGVPLRIRIEWRQQSMPGITEGINLICRGVNCTIAVLRREAGSAVLDIIPRPGKEHIVKMALSRRRERFEPIPGSTALRLHVEENHPGHEAQFAATLNRFLDYIDTGVTEREKAMLNAKYTLLMQAKAAAQE